MMYVAVRTFRDESDGDLIEAGLTHVTREADCYRAHPENFKPATRDLRGPITRVGGSAGLIERPRPRRPAPTRPRPAWQIGPDPLSYKEVELRDRGYVDYKVSLGSSARKAIIAEIERAPIRQPAKRSRLRVGSSASTDLEPTSTRPQSLLPPARSNDPARAARSI